MTDQLINVGIAIDPSGAVTGVSVGEQAFNRLGHSADQLHDKVSHVDKAWGELKATVAGYLGFEAVKGLIEGIGDAFIESEEAGLRFDAVLRATGNSARVSLGEYKDLQNTLAHTTLFSDEQVQDAESRLLTFKSVTGDVFTKTIQLSADLASLMGTDMASASALLGKALDAPADGMMLLRRSGIVLSDAVKQNIKDLVAMGRTSEAQKVILQELEGRVGGLAQSMHQGLSGAIKDAEKAWHEFLENVGKSADAQGRSGPGSTSYVEDFFVGLRHVLQEMTPNLDELSNKTTQYVDIANRLANAQDRLHNLQSQMVPGGGGLFRRQLAADDPNILQAQATVDRLQAQADSLNARITTLVADRNHVATTNEDGTPRDTRSQDTIDNVKKLTDAAEKQRAEVGLNTAAIARYEAVLAGATAAEANHIASLARDAEAGKKIAELTNAVAVLRGTLGANESVVAGYTATQQGMTDAQAATIQELTRQKDVLDILNDATKGLSDSTSVDTAALKEQALAAGATSDELNQLLDITEQIDQANQDAAESAKWLREHAPPKPPEHHAPENVTEWRMNETTGKMEEHVREDLLPQSMQNYDAEQARWKKIQADAQKAAQESSKFWQDAWTQAAHNTQDILANFIDTVTSEGHASFEAFMEDILRMINKIAAQMAAAGLIKIVVGAFDGLPSAPHIPSAGDVSNALANTPDLPNVPLKAPEMPNPESSISSADQQAIEELLASIPDHAPRSVPSGNVDMPSLSPGRKADQQDDSGDGELVGAGGTVHVHQAISFQISAIDTQDMEAALRRQKGTIAAVVAEAAQQSTGFASQLTGRKR